MHIAEVLQVLLNSPQESVAARKKGRRIEEGRIQPEPSFPVFGLLLGFTTLASAGYLLHVETVTDNFKPKEIVWPANRN